MDSDDIQINNVDNAENNDPDVLLENIVLIPIESNQVADSRQVIEYLK